MQSVTETRKLPVALTREEKDQKTDEHCKLLDKIDNDEATAAFNAKHAKEKIKALRLSEQELRTVVETGQEYRSVDCTWTEDWAAKTWLLRRDDTGEVVDHRTMTKEELQREIPFQSESSGHDA